MPVYKTIIEDVEGDMPFDLRVQLGIPANETKAVRTFEDAVDAVNSGIHTLLRMKEHGWEVDSTAGSDMSRTDDGPIWSWFGTYEAMGEGFDVYVEVHRVSSTI